MQARSAGPAGRKDAPLGWGIVGTGTIAERFAEGVRRVGDAAVAAVASRARPRADDFASRHGATAHPDIESLLGDRRVDAVYVATPNDTHPAIARMAIEAGKGVLVEKPLAASLAEAEALAVLAAARRVFLMEGMWTRFLPAVAFARRAVLTDAIGEVRRIDGNLEFRRPYAPHSRFYDPARGGGALLDLGVYLVSLSIWLMGPPEGVAGTWRAAPSGVDSQADVTLRNGAARAHLRCGFERDGANHFIIEGTRGSLVLERPFIGARGVLRTGRPVGRTLAMLTEAPAAGRLAGKILRTVPLPAVRRHRFDFDGYGLQFEIGAATRALREGRGEAAEAPLSHTLETLRIIEQIRRRAPA